MIGMLTCSILETMCFWCALSRYRWCKKTIWPWSVWYIFLIIKVQAGNAQTWHGNGVLSMEFLLERKSSLFSQCQIYCNMNIRNHQPWFWVNKKIFHSPELLGHFGMIPRILTMIIVRENSEVVMKFTQMIASCVSVQIFPAQRWRRCDSTVLAGE